MTQRASRLLAELGFNPHEAPGAVERTIASFADFTDEAKCRASYLVNHWTFRDFVFNHQLSRKLLVNGQEDANTADTSSSVRFVAAQLACRLPPGMASPIICIHYFCAQHIPAPSTSSAVPQRASPGGMIASLVGQLISQMRVVGLEPELSFITRTMRSKARQLDVGALCVILDKLASQAALTTKVICIIDEISVYDSRAEYKEQTDYLMGELTKMADPTPRRRDMGLPRVFKLLVTSQSRAAQDATGNHFDGHTLDLPEYIDYFDPTDTSLHLRF